MLVPPDTLTLHRPLGNTSPHHTHLLAAQVKRVEERLLARGILLRVDAAALDFLADRGFDPAFGAALHAVQFQCCGCKPRAP